MANTTLAHRDTAGGYSSGKFYSSMEQKKARISLKARLAYRHHSVIIKHGYNS